MDVSLDMINRCEIYDNLPANVLMTIIGDIDCISEKLPPRNY
jgi:hypothetical protein